MKILITGVHGFVGSNLVKALSARHTLYGLDIVAPDREGVERTYSWQDLDRGLLPEVDAVIHLAGKAHEVKNPSAAEEYFRVNTGLTQRIYDWFLGSSARQFYFFSTIKAAADRMLAEPIDEQVEPRPAGPYGESKRAAERYLLEHPAADPKRVYILRPCMIHGPGNKGNINLLYRFVGHGLPWPLGSFENRRTFLSVGNLCFLLGQMLEGEVAGGVYNLCDDEAVSTNELVALIGQATGRRARIWCLPRRPMVWLAALGSRLHLPLDSERLRKLTEDYVASNSKVKAALGLDVLPVTARRGLEATFRTFRQ